MQDKDKCPRCKFLLKVTNHIAAVDAANAYVGMTDPVGDAVQEADVSKTTAIDVYRWLREVCSITLLVQPIILGGTVHAVQIDESLFWHKPKVK